MKNILGIHIYTVKSLEEYWIRLAQSLEINLTFLRSKYEYGTNIMCSEYGIQLVLMSYARKIAEKQNINVHKTLCICMAVGMCFPPFGSYGEAVCKKYLKDHNIPWSINDIKIGAIESKISCTGGVVIQELDDALHAYYENDTSIPEVNVARYCHRNLKKSRTLMKNGMSAVDSIKSIMDEAAEYFSVEHSMIEDEYIEIPNEVHEQVIESLKEFTEYSGIVTGICEFLV